MPASSISVARRCAKWMRGPNCLRHRHHVVVRAAPETADAEADAVRRRRHRVEQRLVVGGGRGDARQAEQRARRIVGMQGQPNAKFVRDRRHAFEKRHDVGAHLVRRDAAIGRDALGERREVLRRRHRAGQPGRDVARQGLDLAFAHRVEGLSRTRLRRRVIVGGRAVAPEHEQVERREAIMVEAQRGRAGRQRKIEVGAGPVDHRHHVVTDDADAFGRDRPHAFDPRLDRARASALAQNVVRAPECSRPRSTSAARGRPACSRSAPCARPPPCAARLRPARIDAAP